MLAQYPTTHETSRSNIFPLTFAARGETVTLKEICAGDKLCKRLSDLGLHIGMQVRIVQGDSCGPVILAVANDCRLALGRGMAQKIMVSSGGR